MAYLATAVCERGANAAIAGHLALMYGRMQRVRELVVAGSFPPQYGGSNVWKGTPVVRLGAIPLKKWGIAVAREY